MTRKAFLSYSRSSESAVQQVHDDLLKAGIDEVWYDKRLIGAQDWWDTILLQIRAADVVVCLVDVGMQDSLAVRHEYQYAEALGKPLLPILLTGDINIASLPTELSGKQHVDYSEQNPHRFERLAQAIESLPAAAPLPQPLPPAPSVPVSDRDYLDQMLLGGANAGPLSEDNQIRVFRILRSLTLSSDEAERQYAMASLAKLRARRELLADIAADIDVLLVSKSGSSLVKTAVISAAIFSFAIVSYYFYTQRNILELESGTPKLTKGQTPVVTVEMEEIDDSSSMASDTEHSLPAPSAELSVPLHEPAIVEKSKPVSSPESKSPDQRAEKEAPAVAETAIVAAELPAVVGSKNAAEAAEKEALKPTHLPADDPDWRLDFSLFASDQFDLCGYRDFSVTRSSRTGAATELTVSSKDRSIPDRPFRGFEIKVLSGQAVELLPECIVRLDYYNDTGTARIRVRVRGMQ